jgi:hypothetical protein
VELGEDLGGEGLVAEDLEGAVLGQQDQATSRQPPRMATRAWPSVTRQNVAAGRPQAAGHLLLGRVGVAQAGATGR